MTSLILNAIASLLALKADHTFDRLKDHIDDLKARLTAELPAKADGSEWSDADVLAAKAAADLQWNLLKGVVAQADGDDGA